MELKTLSLIDAVSVAKRMRHMDKICLEAATTIEDPEIFGLNRWQTDGAAWSLHDDSGVPIAMGGISMNVPWIGVAWFVATDQMTVESWKKLIRHSRTVFRNAAKAMPRIEAHVIEGWDSAKEYARRLGFEYEGTRYRAGRDGQDIHTYVYKVQT